VDSPLSSISLRESREEEEKQKMKKSKIGHTHKKKKKEENDVSPSSFLSSSSFQGRKENIVSCFG
jgi:hypothetical protein